MIREEKNIRYTENCALDVQRPAGGYKKVLLYFHGGGLVSGDKSETHSREVGRILAERGICFVTANYRLLPEAAFPACIEDAARAVAYVKAGIAAGRELYVWGQSGGGYLALMLALCEKYLAAAGASVRDVAGWFIESAQPTVHFSVLKYRGEDERLVRIDESAPLYFLGSVSLPKMHLIVYDDDMPCRYEQNMLFYKTALHFEPQAPLTVQTLHGTHCRACFDESERPLFVRALETFMGEE